MSTIPASVTPTAVSRPGKPPLQKLKAERVELMLARLPGWVATADRSALWRSFELGAPHQAMAFAACMASFLAERGGNVTFRKDLVTVWLEGVQAEGLTPAVAMLARRIDRVAGEMQKVREGR